ncbi:MAG: ribonuclease III [Clostridia bacterium]
MKKLESIIGYEFRDPQFLRTALSHSSYANEVKGKKRMSNERIEFLGDSVLGFVTASFLYEKHPDVMEGELTKMRAALVCEGALCVCAREISLGEFLLLGHGEECSGGRNRDSILADALESLIGAIYLDGGESSARTFIYKFLLERGAKNADVTDYKTELQEIVQKNPGESLSYRLADSYGPDHNKNFAVEVLLNSNVIGRGRAHSKKEAEQMAAKEALKLMGL